MSDMGKRVPQRMCISCRERFPQNSLIRIGEENEKVIFLSNNSGLRKKITGRTVYLCKSEKCILKASKKKLVEKALKLNLQPQEYKELEAAIEKTV